MQGRRVAVTGLGVVAPCGIGIDAFWDGLCGPAPVGNRRVHDFDPDPWFDNPKEVRRADRCTQFAIAAAHMALEQAGDLTADPGRSGVWIGTGIGGIQTLEEQIKVRLDKGDRRVSPFLVPMMMANAATAAVSMRHGFQGPAENSCTACAAGTHAVANAARLVATGRCDVMIAGGSEAAFVPTALAGFTNMTAFSSAGISRPFDADRDGFVMGEGAGILVLEEWETAIDRGATIIAEVLGGASTADAHHITAPAPGGAGAVACMELAMEEAGVTAAQIGHINAHGHGEGLRHAGAARDFHQGDHWTRPGGGRCPRSRGAGSQPSEGSHPPDCRLHHS
jgi:3-oxoacyl-[acyl-carrier-protein] synthase II